MNARPTAIPGKRPQDGPLSILIAALGGQGGGVLTEWIVAAARSAGLVAQATSTPGVSQRTGATTYYVEIFDPDAGLPIPPLALAPLPGRVDVLVCAELLEAARMLERGMCTPTRTSLIASTHRAYTTAEKMSAGDGRYDEVRVAAALRAMSRRAVLFDMEALRHRHATVISAVLYGALAGSGALPLPRDACEAAIASGGKGAHASLAAFGEAFALAAGMAAEATQANHRQGAASAATAATTVAPTTTSTTNVIAAAEADPALAARLAALPPALAAIAAVGAARAADFQNAAYARLYVARVEGVTASAAGAESVAVEAARTLALWMCYDDVIRVATIKARLRRFDRIRAEAGAGPDDVVRVHDYFKPGPAEIAAVLPGPLGRLVERNFKGRGPAMRINATSMTGMLALRAVGALRRLRPWSLRFAREQAAIEDWLAMLRHTLGKDGGGMALALQIARLPRSARGYGATHAYGAATRDRLFGEVRDGTVDAEALRLQIDKANAAPSTAGCGSGGTPSVQPVTWIPSLRR